jgi:hypothetical protein
MSMMVKNATALQPAASAMKVETIEQFLARGGTIARINDHPAPEGRVMRKSSHRAVDFSMSPFGHPRPRAVS